MNRFDNLETSDLKKIISALEALEKRRLEASEFNKSAKIHNSRLEAENEARKVKEEAQEKALRDEFSKKYLDPLLKRMDEIWNYLYAHRLNLLDRFLRDTVEIDVRPPSFHVKKKGGEAWLQEYKALSQTYQLNLKRLPKITRSAPQNIIPLKKEPNSYVTLKVNGVSFRIHKSPDSVATIKKILSKKTDEKIKEKEKVDELRARAATKELEVRAQARQFVPKGLSEQLKIFPNCPYCRGDLSHSIAHLDHIHPVSKGGLSVNRNLVFVCSKCNLKKKDKTLGVYCSIEKIDILFVHEILGKLRKDF